MVARTRAVPTPTRRGRSALLELARPTGHRLEQRPRDLAVALDERFELPTGEAVRDAVARRSHRRGPDAAVDQGDLAEVVAGAERASIGSLDRHLGRARFEHEEPGTAGSLRRQLLPVGELSLGELRREAAQLLLGQRLEERDVLEDLDGC